MEVQEMSLFELALDLIQHNKFGKEISIPPGQLSNLVAEKMSAESMPEGEYTWGNCWVMRFGKDKMGSPWVTVFERPSMSLSCLPGWDEWCEEREKNLKPLPVEG